MFFSCRPSIALAGENHIASTRATMSAITRAINMIILLNSMSLNQKTITSVKMTTRMVLKFKRIFSIAQRIVGPLR